MTKLPRKEPLVKKFYFDLDTPNGPSKEFQRHGYQLIGETTFTLVHYLGDQSAAVDFCHRNSTKSSNHNFVRTLPSKMKEFEKASAIDHANIVYKKEVGSLDCPPESIPVTIPRDMKQLRNMRYKQLQQFRLSRDDLYNIHEIAYDISGFTRRITTFPDLICVCGLQVSECMHLQTMCLASTN